MGSKIIRPRQTVNQTDPTQAIRGEWLVTNGLGGYASGTIIGVMTRKYHALLISALSKPLGRFIMLNHLIEEVIIGEKKYLLNCEEHTDRTLNLEALAYLKDFYLEDGMPIWRYQINDVIIYKKIFMTYRQNTVYISYTLYEGAEKITLKLFPCLHFRPHESPVNLPFDEIYSIKIIGDRYEFSKPNFTPLRMFAFSKDPGKFNIETKFFKFVKIDSTRII